MEWSAKIPSQWDWENLMMVGGKAIDVHQKQIRQPTDWGIDGGIDNGSLYSSGGGGSDLGNSSSSKSSISASVDSSSNIASRTSNFNFDNNTTTQGSQDDLSTKKELGRVDNTGSFVASAAASEHLIGLKLGKRTYFEAGTTTKPPSFSVIPSSPAVVAAATTVKRSRASSQSTQAPHCQVEGCNLDLTSAKDYHRRHRVCETHSKCPKVIIAGLERRFCQQCSRFHDLCEFDEKKRSCRRRLSDHNARRRKPQPDAVQFNSGRLPSSFYDGTPQLNVLLNSVPLVHERPTVKPTWENDWNFKPGEVKGSLFRPAKVGGNNGQLHLPTNLPNVVSALHHDSCRLLPHKGSTTEVLNQGLEAPGAPPNLDTTNDLPRALSLLSNNSWNSGLHEPAYLDQLMQANQARIAQPMLHSTTQGQGWTLATSEYWQAEQQQPAAAAESRAHSQTLQNTDGSSSQFQEFQLFKAPFDSAFYCNRIN